MSALTAFERRVLDACLAGETPVLAALRSQAEQATVERREDTGDGMRTWFVLPDAAAAVEPAAMNFTDVDLDIAGVDDGASTSLWVIRGRLAFLEIVAYDGPWPATPELRGLRYLREVQIAAGTWSATPVDARDPATLARALAGVQADEYGG